MSKIYFQGTYGAYSHLAALEVEPNAEIIPCKTFDECFLKASSENGSRIVIPESNRITGNIGIEYFIVSQNRDRNHRIKKFQIAEKSSNC